MDREKSSFYLIVCGVVLFNNWALGLLLNFSLLRRGGSISELSAVDQPHSIIFRILDVVSGLLLTAGFYLWVRQRGLSRPLRLVGRCGIILGLANCIDALLPLPCSGTVDKVCNWPVRIDWQRISLPDHAFSSTVIGLLFLVIPLIVWVWARSYEDRRVLVISAASVVTILAFFGALSTANPFIDRVTGFVQEVQLLSFSWLVVEIVRKGPIKTNKSRLTGS